MLAAPDTQRPFEYPPMPRFSIACLVLFTVAPVSATHAANRPHETSIRQHTQQRHDARWRELAPFVPVRAATNRTDACVVTLTDEHVDTTGSIIPEVLRHLSGQNNIVGISLRNLSISNSAISALKPFHSRLRVLDLYGTRIDDRALESIGAFLELRELDLGVTRVTSSGLSSLKSLKRLQVLELSGRRINDTATSSVGHLTSLEHLSLAGTRVTDKGITSLATLAKLRGLGLAGTRIEGATLGSLATLPQLSLIDLADTDITAASPGHLAACRTLKGLNLENCPLIVDSSTSQLAKLRSLKGLVLTKTGFEKESITGTGLARLATMTGLQHLNLMATRVDDKAISALATLQDLSHLNLSLTGLGNAGLQHLAKLPRLRKLVVVYQVGFGGTNVTADGLVHFAGHKALRDLDLTGTKIGDADLAKFKAVESLKHLTISGTAITETGANMLRKQMPRCTIVR